MRALPVVVALLGLAVAAVAQEPEALHDELRKVRDDILAAVERNDFAAVAPHLHPNVVFTPMNAEVCRGPEEVRAYFDKMLKGPDAVVKSVRLELEVDRLTDLYGDTGLAFGSSNDRYTLANGMDFTVRTRWTCALVRENGKWLITAFQAAPNVFENPILERAEHAAGLQWGSIGLVAGLLLGLVIGRMMARRRTA